MSQQLACCEAMIFCGRSNTCCSKSSSLSQLLVTNLSIGLKTSQISHENKAPQNFGLVTPIQKIPSIGPSFPKSYRKKSSISTSMFTFQKKNQLHPPNPKQSPAAETITDAWITTGPQKMIPGKSSRKLFLFLSFKVAIVTSNLASTKMCGKFVVGNMLAVHKFNKATPHEHVQDQLQSGSMWFPHHRWCLRRPFCGEGRHRVAHILVEKVGMTVSFLTKSAWWPTETKVRIRMPKLHRPSFS